MQLIFQPKKQGASMKPSKHKMTVLSQIFKLIPRNLIPKLANEFGIDRQSRVFSPTSHVLALVFGQLTHALGLNDICDTLRNHCGLVSKIRDCVPPSRNGLSHANLRPLYFLNPIEKYSRYDLTFILFTVYSPDSVIMSFLY